MEVWRVADTTWHDAAPLSSLSAFAAPSLARQSFYRCDLRGLGGCSGE